MAKKEKFHDPLEEIDPIMEEAFSVQDDDEDEDWEEEEAYDHEDDDDDEEEEVAPAKSQSYKSQKERSSKEKKAEPQKKSQSKSQSAQMNEGGPKVSDVRFPTLTDSEKGQPVELDIFANIPVNLSVELGRSQISLKEVYELTEGSIIELERLVGEPLDLVVNGQVIAQGEVVAIDNNYGLRITNIVASAQK